MQDIEIDEETATYEQMVGGLLKHIFGPAEKGILNQLKQSENLAQDIGAMTYTLVNEAAQQGEQAGREMTLDILMGVATEVIDSLMMMAEAAGLIDDPEDEAMKEDAMMMAVKSYLMNAEPGSEEQEAAKQMLRAMKDEGMFAEAEQTIAAMGARHGVDPFADDDGVPGVDPAAAGMQPPAQPAAPRRQIMAAG